MNIPQLIILIAVVGSSIWIQATRRSQSRPIKVLRVVVLLAVFALIVAFGILFNLGPAAHSATL